MHFIIFLLNLNIMNTAHVYERNKDSLKLTFLPFTTFIDPLFWNRINHLKVNKWKLDESPKRITGSYTIYGDQSSDSLLCFDQNSIDEDEVNKSDSGQFWLHGTFILFNLKSVFVGDYDRKQFLEESSQSLWKIIASREWITNTQLLNPFLLTAWADIKNFVYYFWNCLPALVFPDNLCQLNLDPSPNNELHTMALNFFATNEKRPFLLIDDKSPTTLEELISIDSPDRFLLVFPNSSSVKYQLNWLVRNLIAAIAYLRTDWTSLRIFALSHLAAASFIIKIRWNPVHKIIDRVPRCVGWERTAKNKMECRSVDLKRFFDPIRILEQTVDLNLKLIRWRHAPSIDLERFTSLRVLLLGAGTLGCNIARALLGWESSSSHLLIMLLSAITIQ